MPLACFRGGRGWRGSGSSLEAVSAGVWTPVVVHRPPHTGAWPLCQCVSHTPVCWGAHTENMEEQHPRQQELSVVEQWRTVHLYRGRGKTAASLVQSCGSPLYLQAPQL